MRGPVCRTRRQWRVLVFPQAEGFCNHGSSYPQCANIDIFLNVDLGNGSGSPIDEGLCGHSNGNCVNGGPPNHENQLAGPGVDHAEP